MDQDVREFLQSRGWDVSAVSDLCWMDHSDSDDLSGYRKVIADASGQPWEIILCPEDALVLERGAWRGDYSGSLTPADSKAPEWPWALLAAA